MEIIKMDIYLAYWDNGLEYDDWRYKLIGVFTSNHLAKNACKEYTEWFNKQNDLNKIYYPKSYTYIVKQKINRVYYKLNKAAINNQE